MPIYKWVRKDIEKYSFITKTEMKLGIVHVYYEHENIKGKKKIPYRADKNKLIKLIEKIKKEINYKEIKKQRDEIVKNQLEKDKKEKTILFAYSSD